jgi:hypothetical protein
MSHVQLDHVLTLITFFGLKRQKPFCCITETQGWIEAGFMEVQGEEKA